MLPHNLQVFERGWLSANQILLRSPSYWDVIDSGFCTHIDQTQTLLEIHQREHPDLQPRFLVNTHLHSDHCGGNAHLSQTFGLKIMVPGTTFDAVQNWDEASLGFKDLGQPCPVFTAFGAYQARTVISLGEMDWEVYCAPGHDSDAQLLFNPQYRILISGDALWEKGFGALFPKPDGQVDFSGAFASLELIQSLDPKIVIPGHGTIFSKVRSAIDFAMSRLDYLAKNPTRNLLQVACVLLKFKLLEWHTVSLTEAQVWFTKTPMLQRLANDLAISDAQLFTQATQSLVNARALIIKENLLSNY